MRLAPPPDFRYVWLLPGPTSGAVALAAGTFAVGAFGVALWGAGHQPTSLAVTLAGGAAVALILARKDGPNPRAGTREVAMAITPWGIVVDPDGEERVLHWPAIRRVRVDVAHTLRGGIPSVVSSLVTIETDRENFAGRTFGAANLEGLTVHLDAYAEEATRPPALDLDGFEPAYDGALPSRQASGFVTRSSTPEACLDSIIQRADELCATGSGAARLSLPTGGYRTMASRAAAPETIADLRAALSDSASCPADPRALAAILAVMLDARELVPDLLRLVAAPHPLTAGVAKAAATLLGAPPNRAGAIDEVLEFLFPEDFATLTAWLQDGGRRRASAA